MLKSLGVMDPYRVKWPRGQGALGSRGLVVMGPWVMEPCGHGALGLMGLGVKRVTGPCGHKVLGSWALGFIGPLVAGPWV